MWRAFFLAIGITMCILGAECMAIERFELAVESRGGDLMVDEGPDGTTREPDDPRFALPKRGEDERNGGGMLQGHSWLR